MKTIRLLIPAVILAFAAPSMAADVNTYRPGQTYAAVQMPNADVCALQCSGDAQCYGWNFLRSGAPTGAGVCELNAVSSAAVAHPFAVSGDNGGRSYGASNVVQGNTRTFRIGSPEAARPASAPRPVMQTRAPRRPVEAPVIRKRTFAPTTRQQAPQATLTQQQAAQMQARRAAQSKQQTQMQAQKQVQARPQTTMQQPQTMPASTQRVPAMSRAPYAQHQPQARRQMQNRPAQQTAPTGYPQQARPQQQMMRPMPGQNMQPQRQAPQPSLYGSLNDVPKGPTSGQAVAAFGRRMAQAKQAESAATPKSPTPPLYSQRGADKPDSPISTAVPVAPIDRTKLQMAGEAPQ